MNDENPNSWQKICEAYEQTPWEVRYEADDEGVYIYPGRRMTTAPGIYVRPPNLIERLLGITFERKIVRATRRIQRRADRLEQMRITKAKNNAMVALMREEGRIP